MNTTLHSFMDIFQQTFSNGQDEVKLEKIIIPIIQRDYAQGRAGSDIKRVRDRFLEALLHAVEEEPITLDFVYGDINDDGVMTPLDGQQRLTTLFLLHWYAAKKDQVPEPEYDFLNGFGYETRYSARNFCKDLLGFVPSFEGIISEEIIDQAWFPLEWKKDPTVSSMLVMIDAIHQRFSGVEHLWEKLKNGAITFYFLPIKDMGLTDELYIKMNSRGKPLTRFEHFKAELERSIREIDEETAKRIIRKVDLDWTDMLWQYRDSGSGIPEDSITDDEFLRYFHFICDIICYKRGESPQGRSSDEFDMLSDWFSGDRQTVLENIATLEEYFDCWCCIDGYNSPADFLETFLTHEHAPGKISIDNRNKIDIFEDCLHAYGERSGLNRLFPLNRVVLLYTIVCYLRNKAQIPDEAFRVRLRMINNLIQNSDDAISDRADRSRIPGVIQQIDSIMLTGEIDEDLDANFNPNQLKEEREKKTYLLQFPERREEVSKLEDHPRLNGQISIIGIDNIGYGERFVSLFECDWDKIDCALMAIGDYGQHERNQKWRYQYASKKMQVAWDSLFHMSAGNIGFENTRNVLIKLLSESETFTDEILQQIADEFIVSCEEKSEYPWRYYYVKYPVYRPGNYGRLMNNNAEDDPYLFSVLQTRSYWSQNSYMPYLKEADDAHLSRDHYGQRLVYEDVHVVCGNDCYMLRANDTEEVLETVPIRQNEDGIDIEDRILVLKKYLDQKFGD